MAGADPQLAMRAQQSMIQSHIAKQMQGGEGGDAGGGGGDGVFSWTLPGLQLIDSYGLNMSIWQGGMASWFGGQMNPFGQMGLRGATKGFSLFGLTIGPPKNQGFILRR